ncbi:hypothetical protein D3C87_2204010 [compost metagenome]
MILAFVQAQPEIQGQRLDHLTGILGTVGNGGPVDHIQGIVQKMGINLGLQRS